MTNSEPDPVKTSEVKSDGYNVDGISLTWGSEEPCSSGGTNSFTAIVMCDKTVIGEGNGRIDSVDTIDACNPIATVSHESGCPIELNVKGSGDNGPLMMIIIIFCIAVVVLCIVFVGAICVCAKGKKKDDENK